jgi:hypothetical protein
MSRRETTETVRKQLEKLFTRKYKLGKSANPVNARDVRVQFRFRNVPLTNSVLLTFTYDPNNRLLVPTELIRRVLWDLCLSNYNWGNVLERIIVKHCNRTIHKHHTIYGHLQKFLYEDVAKLVESYLPATTHLEFNLDDKTRQAYLPSILSSSSDDDN